MGDTLYQSGDYKEALKVFQETLKLDRSQNILYKKIAKAHEKLGEYALSLESYNKYIEKNKNDEDAILSQGMMLMRLNKNELALEKFQHVIDINLKNARAHTHLGIAQQSLGDYGHAFQSFNRAIDLEPDDPELYFYLGNAYFEKEEYLGAIVSYERTLNVDPNYKRVYRKMALSHHFLYNETEALKYLKKAIQRPLQEDILSKSYGIYYQNQMELKAALNWFKSAFNEEMDASEYLYHQGEVLFKLGKIEKAIKELEDGLKDEKSFAYVHRLLGQIYTDKNLKKAIHHYELYISYYPSNQDVDFIADKVIDLKKEGNTTS